MSVRLHHLIYAALAIGVVAFVVSRCGSEEGRIARQLDGLAELIAKEGDESGLAMAGRARRLGDHFTDAFVIALEPFGIEIRDRASLARHFAAYRQGAETIDARWADRDIALGAGERTATATADAVLTARWSAGRPPGRERYRLRFDLRLEDRQWKIDRLTLVEVVEGGERFF